MKKMLKIGGVIQKQKSNHLKKHPVYVFVSFRVTPPDQTKNDFFLFSFFKNKWTDPEICYPR